MAARAARLRPGAPAPPRPRQDLRLRSAQAEAVCASASNMSVKLAPKTVGEPSDDLADHLGPLLKRVRTRRLDLRRRATVRAPVAPPARQACPPPTQAPGRRH